MIVSKTLRKVARVCPGVLEIPAVSNLGISMWGERRVRKTTRRCLPGYAAADLSTWGPLLTTSDCRDSQKQRVVSSFTLECDESVRWFRGKFPGWQPDF